MNQMITGPWWVVPALVGFGALLGAAVALWVAVAGWRNRIDALVLGRVDAVTTAVLAGLIEREEPGLGLVPPADPWATSLQRVHDGLQEPEEPKLPTHEWFRELTGPLAILAAPAPEAAAIVAEVVEEAKPRARTRFEGEPKPPATPVEAVVCVEVADEVRAEKVTVPA